MRIQLFFVLCSLFVLPVSASLSGQQIASNPPQALSLAELKKKIEGDNRNKPLASVQWAEEALKKLAVEPDPVSELWFLTSLVGDLIALCDYPKAEVYLEKGRKLVARSGDLRGHLLLEIEAAVLLQVLEKPGEVKLLLDGIIPSLETYRSKNLQDREIGSALGRGYRLRGSVLQTMGRYSEAIDAFHQTQKLCEELGDRRQQSIVLDQMGRVYALLDRPKEAVASHIQAIQMAEELPDVALQGAFYIDLARTYAASNNSDAQLAALKQAVNLARKAEDSTNLIRATVNLADVYLRKKDYTSALEYADEALKLPGITEDPSSIATCMINRGIALNRLGNSDEGIKAIQEGLRYKKTTQNKSDIAEVMGNLAEEHAFAGDFRKAFETECEFKILSDQLKRADDQKHIAEASAAFESDKKQIEIEALQRERRIQLRLTMLWIALGVLGFSVAGLLIVSHRKLQQVNDTLTVMNNQNLDLITKLQSALSEVQALQGLIPICAHCKKIRNDEGYWSQMETYIQSRTGALFSHGICPDCAKGQQAEIDQWRTEGDLPYAPPFRPKTGAP